MLDRAERGRERKLKEAKAATERKEIELEEIIQAGWRESERARNIRDKES